MSEMVECIKNVCGIVKLGLFSEMCRQIANKNLSTHISSPLKLDLILSHTNIANYLTPKLLMN